MGCDFRLFCFTFGSNTTRLLNTPMIGATIEIVPSSRIDMLPGLSRCHTFRIPPCFCACAVPGIMSPAKSATTLIAANRVFSNDVLPVAMVQHSQQTPARQRGIGCMAGMGIMRASRCAPLGRSSA